MIFKLLSQKNYTPLNINRPKRLDQLLILALCIFFIGNIIGLIIYIAKVNQSPLKTSSSVRATVNKKDIKADIKTDTIQIVKTSSTSSKLNLQESNMQGTAMQFTSYKLGLRFNYLTHWWRKTDSIEDKPTDVFVSRSANKVCITNAISSSSENCTDGQYIIIFNKDTKIPFKKIIEEDLLNNNKDCVISTHKSGDKEIAEAVPLTNKCPEIYSKRSVDRYFQYDSRFPDRFVFVSLSQQPIFADTNHTTWEMTLELF